MTVADKVLAAAEPGLRSCVQQLLARRDTEAPTTLRVQVEGLAFAFTVARITEIPTRE